jgi:hypothetical protein
VLPPAGDRDEPKPERLPAHVHRAGGEVGREQQPLLGQALEPVKPADGHQILQARPVTLPGPL